MCLPAPMRCVLSAADLAQASAVEAALAAAGIECRLHVEDDGAGYPAVEVHVPAGRVEEAQKIIAEGNWPRLA